MRKTVVRALVALFSIATASCASAPPHPSVAACTVSADDHAWIERARLAWRTTSHDITGIAAAPHFQAVFFDAQCELVSPNALTESNARRVTWVATLHNGAVALPDGDHMPPAVTSFTKATPQLAYFVMSTPSVWRAGGVDGGPLGLETLMVAVMLHEGSHVAQSATYGAAVTALSARYHLPDDFNDDSIQQHFQNDADFAASETRETDLLFNAATAPDDVTARRLASEARALMRARAQRFFVGDLAYMNEAEDLWLTMEGSGQWAGYAWLISLHGANAPVSTAMLGFARRGRWWSQNEGLALFLVLDRLAGPNWKQHAYGDGAQTVLQMLDATLAR